MKQWSNSAIEGGRLWSKVRLFALIVGVCALFTACDSESLQEDSNATRVQFVHQWDGPTPVAKDAVDLNSAQFSGDKLSLSVSYSGGCSEHSFTLYSSSVNIQIYPPVVTTWLVHDGNGDLCEAYLTETIEFDVKDLIADYSSLFFVHVVPAGSSESIQVEYQSP
ncbi:hypothetical protein HQ496_00605 [bacterium]|nr:hypothetical protein [bacterium]